MDSKTKTKRFIKGLIVSWEDENPLDDTSEVIPGKVTHRNQMLRFNAKEIYSRYKNYICDKESFKWVVEIIVVFRYENGVEQRETRELSAHCKLCDLNEYCMDAIKDALKYGSNYVKTIFNVECVGI